MKTAIETALRDFIERQTGVRPDLKPSKKAHASSSAFLRGDAPAAAAALDLHASDCTLFSVPLLKRVTAENGWLLFFFTAEVIDAYAGTLPPPEEPDETYFARRLWIAAQHADVKTPDDPALLDGFYAVLFGAPDGEKRFLSAPRTRDGKERVALENSRARMAKVLLWERRNNLCTSTGSVTRPF